MSDNIQVVIRVRPLNTKESIEPQLCKCIQVDKRTNSVLITVSSSVKQFSYDYIADEDTSQEVIFEKVAKPITLNCLTGYNGTVFSYGQTGSGKTFTIIGGSSVSFNDNQAGIIPRCLDYIFTKTSSDSRLNKDLEYLIKCSFLEIYNEQIKDLLADEPRNLQIREDIKKGVYVEDLTEETILSLEEALSYLAKGLQRRHMGTTLMNCKSSRSHSVFTVFIESKEKREEIWSFRNSLFHIIDLAGSERQKAAGTYGDRLREAAMINKSLSTLGDVINSLVEIAEGKNRYVRYRDSKLTFLLKDSIGGNSKTCIVANISPSFISYGETLSTLRFAERAKFVRNKAVINEDTIGTINELKSEVKRLKLMLKGSSEVIGSSSRIRGLEELLEKNTRIRLVTESALQQEIENKENFIQELTRTIRKFEDKVNNEKLVNRLKEEGIRRLQKGEKLAESQVVSELRQEVQLLRRENQNHPVAAKYFVENDSLKHHISFLENELKEAPGSLSYRLKLNQEYTEDLTLRLEESLQDQKVLEQQNERLLNKTQDLEQTLASSESHKLDLLSELESKKQKILALEDQFSTQMKKAPMKPLDLNIKQGRPSISFQENRACEECGNREDKIFALEKKVNLLIQTIEDLKFYEEDSFRLSEELKKIKHELNSKDLTIEEMYEDLGLLTAENEMYAAQIMDFTHQINEKSNLISELTGETQVNVRDLQDVVGIKEQNGVLGRELMRLQGENTKITQDMILSVQSREQMIEKLKKMQDTEYALQKECDEIRVKFREVLAENKVLKKQLDDTTKEVVKLTGHNNINQKISYLSKLKEDFNSLKEVNIRQKEELRKKNEKIEEICRKYEKLVKANGMKDAFIEDDEMEKMRVLSVENEMKCLRGVVDGIRGCLMELPFFGEVCEESVEGTVRNVIKRLNEEICEYETGIRELNKEVGRKESMVRIMESELLLIKQKNEFCMGGYQG